MKLKDLYFYDLEVYPNLFVGLFYNKSEKIVIFRTISDMLDFVKSDCGYFVGYNSYRYDNCVLTWIDQHYEEYKRNRDLAGFLRDLERTSSQFISNDELTRLYQRNTIVKRGVDLVMIGDLLLKDMITDDDGNKKMKLIPKKSLKLAGTSLRYPRLKEFSHTFGKDLPVEMLEECYDYCRTDVEITTWLGSGVPKEYLETPLGLSTSEHGLLEPLELRDTMQKKYGVYLMYKDKSTMGNVLNNKMYAEYSRIPEEQFTKDRTEYDYLKFSDIILDEVIFQTQELQDFVKKIKSIDMPIRQIIGEQGSYDDFSVKAFSNEFVKTQTTFCELPISFALGGLHSETSSQIFTKNKYSTRTTIIK